MNKLSRDDLYTLEAYAEQRSSMRSAVMAHKRKRRLAIGPVLNLYFEDRLTMHYQIQEMLRVERIFEAEGIQEELDSYNPLIPDGTNWKATMMIEIPDPEQRKQELEKLVGIEDRCYVQIAGFEKVFAQADEDMDRSTEEKTSSVHFLRYELSVKMIAAFRAGATVAMGVDHPAYAHRVEAVAKELQESLLEDLA